MVVKVASLLAGALCMYFGYRLLMRGIYPDADEKAVWDNTSLLIKRGIPGIAFALFGASIIVMSLLYGSDTRRREAPAAAEQSQKQVEDVETSSAQTTPSDLRPAQPKPRASARQMAQPTAPRKARQLRTLPDDDPSPATTTRDGGSLARPGRA